MNKLSLIGKRFNRLLVISEAPVRKQKSFWNCACDCGNELVICGSGLMNGQTQSCGCLQKERASAATFKHKATKTTEYYSWVNMKTRCYNRKCEDYKDYGGRGIAVCDKWRNDFVAFLEDMGKKPSKRHSIDRINTDGNYEPNNCRWGTDEVQSRNKRSNRWFEHNGIKMILDDWADYFGCHQGNLSNSIKTRGFDGVYDFYMQKYGSLPVNTFVKREYQKY